LNAVPRP